MSISVTVVTVSTIVVVITLSCGRGIQLRGSYFEGVEGSPQGVLAGASVTDCQVAGVERRGVSFSALCGLPILTVVGKSSILPLGAVGSQAGTERLSSLRT